MTKPVDIDSYISQFPPDVQTILAEVRNTIRSAAPDAKEVISYQMPAFKGQAKEDITKERKRYEESEKRTGRYQSRQGRNTNERK